MKKRTKYLIAGVLLLCLAGFLSYRYQHTFTTEKWISDPSHRTRIVDDLLDTYTLTGMTEAEVRSLLGADDNDLGYFNESDRFVYYMGDERGLISIDSEWLIVEFSDGIVSNFFITTD